MSEDINFGAITEALNDKADRDLNNMTANIDYVVERYDDEKGNWYEVWKSGWLRQGGKTESVSDIKIITFLKPFSSVGYSVVVSVGNKEGTGFTQTPANALAYTATTFRIGQYGGSSLQILYWQAEGQGA